MGVARESNPGGQRGRGLELRVPPVAVGAASGAAMWVIARVLPAWQLRIPGWSVAAAVVAAAGVAVSLAGVREFRRAHTTVDPTRPATSTSLVTSGIYRYTRNPMYVGFTGVLLGWAIWLASPPALIVVALYVVYITRFQIVPEERVLRASFGDAFAAYCARTRRWL